MEIRYSNRAFKQLKKIAQSNKKHAEDILNIIEEYCNNPEGNFDIKKLKGRLEGFLRLRKGNYRVIFYIENKTMRVATINHRKDAYND